MQPITAQLRRRNGNNKNHRTAQRNERANRLNKAYKQFENLVACTWKRSCSPEQKKIRRAALILIALVVGTYLGKRYWPRRVRPSYPPATPESIWQQDRTIYARAHGAMLNKIQQNPTLMDDPTFKRYWDAAASAVSRGDYKAAIGEINYAAQQAARLLSP